MAIEVQVIFYSMRGHVYKMAQAVAEGAKQVPGAEVSLYQVPELVPDDVLEKYGAKAARASFASVPVAKVDQLPEAHASGAIARHFDMNSFPLLTVAAARSRPEPDTFPFCPCS